MSLAGRRNLAAPGVLSSPRVRLAACPQSPFSRHLGSTRSPRAAGLIPPALAVCWLLGTAAADLPAVNPPAVDVPVRSMGQLNLEEAPPAARSLLQAVVLANLPEAYENTKKWGGQKKVLDGWHIKADGLRISTRRKWKEVPHGTWKKYQLSLVDPKEFLVINVANVRRQGPGDFHYDLQLAARVKVYGRLQEWARGVRLFSISAEAVADVELQLRMRTSLALDPTRIPPDVLVRPTAEAAQLKLKSLRLQRISKAKGPIVKELGDGLEDVLRAELADKNDQLVAKINRQIAKKQDDLRLSLHDLVIHDWLGLDELLPNTTPLAE